MEQLIQILVPMAILIFGLFFVLRMIIPRSTRTAIQHAIWHRIICGSSNNAISFSKVAKYLLIGIALLLLFSRI